MTETYNVYYVEQFPIDKLTDRGTSGWHSRPEHTRSRYRFDDAILEHIDNTFCEPIQVLMRAPGQIVAGPSGVVRLHALIHKRNWNHIPAIVSCDFEPDWLDTSVSVTTKEQLRSYYRLEPRDCGFEPDGRALHHNFNPSPEQVVETLEVSPETKERVLAMLKVEQGV